ncbi:STRAP [Cordylochernes scorpioides]|uniref:Serine-threonine kinase receptor-associated protein n=1 Tax=Cordylochernes scorpioides TaxID=51811 RepID=A0ABY6LA14_9ARAC|nr:STRAP [Cordylochernes scorpioides]
MEMATSLNSRQAALTCSGHTRPVVYLSFSPITKYGYYLISACKDGKPMLRQGETGDWIGTFIGHKGAVWGVALNHDASRSATGAADFMAKLWNAVSGEEIHSFPHQHIVRSVDFNKAGDKLLTGGSERILKVFDLNHFNAGLVSPSSLPVFLAMNNIQLTPSLYNNGSKHKCRHGVVPEPAVFKGHQGSIRQALYLNDSILMSASDDKTVSCTSSGGARFWDKRLEKDVRQLHFSTCPSSLELSPDRSTLVVAYGRSVGFWSVSGSDPCHLLQELSVPTSVNSASLHPSKSVFVCAGEDCKVYKYDYLTGVELECFKGHFGTIHCIRFSPDGELYATGSEDGTLRLWQTTVGKNYGLWRCGTSPDKSPNGEILDM